MLEKNMTTSHWLFESSEYTGSGTVDTANDYMGQPSLHILDDSSSEEICAFSPEFVLSPDNIYHATAHIKTNNAVTTRSLAAIEFLDKDKNVLGQLEGMSTRSAEWTDLSVLFSGKDMPPATCAGRFRLIPASGDNAATGAAWFAACCIQQLVSDANAIPAPQLEAEEDLTNEIVIIDNPGVKSRKNGLPLKLTDGNILTFWEAEPEDTKPVLEISWGRPKTPGRLILLPTENIDFSNTLKVAAYHEDACDFATPQSCPVSWSGKCAIVDLSTLPVTRKLKLYFETADAAHITELRFYARRIAEENWHGYWIWHTREVEGHIQRILRKKFSITKPVKKAWFQGKCDDSGIFYLNGFQIEQGEITEKLKSGNNILSVEVTNHRYEAGSISELSILYEDGSCDTIKSDKTWKTAPKSQEITALLPFEYDDSNWKNVIEIAQPPHGIWGAVPYTMYVGKTPVCIAEKFAPETAIAGKDISLRLKLVPERQLPPRVPVTLRIMRNKRIFLETELDNTYQLSGTAANQTVILEKTIHLHDFWVPGKYDISISAPFVDFTDNPALESISISNDRMPAPAVAQIEQDSANMPYLSINGEKTRNIFYTVPYAAGYGMQTRMIHEFHNAGCKIARAWVYFNVSDDGVQDFSDVDSMVGKILNDNPDAMILLCYMPDRGIKDNFFQKKYPEELVVFDNGRVFQKPSLASEPWHRFVGSALKDFVRHVRTSPYADKVIGYVTSGGEEGQWLHHWGGNDPAQDGTFSDYSMPMVRYFRRYLREKYGTDQALQEAWHDPAVTLENAAIPTREARVAPAKGMFRDPIRDIAAIDYGKALSQCINDNLKYYARIIKQETDRQSLTGYFYGHLADVGDGYIAEQSGYLAQEDIINCDDIDFFCGPLEYRWFFRDLGGVSSFDYPTPSMLRLHKKLWIQEDDLRTHLFPQEYAYSIRRPEESIAVLAREYAKCLTGGALMYLHEFGTDHRNWDDDTAYLKALAKLQKLAADSAKSQDSTAPVSEIAVIASDRTFHGMRQEKRYVFTDQAGTRSFFQRADIGRIGAPYEEYLTDAFLNDSMPDYKFYIFLNAFCLTEQERAAILKKLEKNHATALWFYAPGYSNEKQAGTDGIREMTGIQVEANELPDDTRMKLLSGNPLLPDYSNDFGMYPEDRQSPVFTVSDQNAEILGCLLKSGKPSLARRKIGNVMNYYASFPMLPARLLRAIAAEAGVHIYMDTDDAFYACQDYFAVHTNKTAGPRIIHLPDNRDIEQIYPETVKLGKTAEINFDSTCPETRIYRRK